MSIKGPALPKASTVSGPHIPAIAHHRIIEVDPALLSGPGLSMLDAAEAIARAREALP